MTFKLTHIFGLLLLMLSCKGKQEQISPVIKSITESVYASGIIKSVGQYQVFSTVSGLVQEIYVKEGDTISENSAILKIEGKTAALSQENAILDFRYNEEKIMGELLKDLENQIDLAKNRMENDLLLLERQKDIWKNSGGSLNDLEQRELNSKSSIATYNSLLVKYKDFKKQLKYNVDHSAKNLQITNAVVGDYVLRSEINGRIYDLLKEKGELVSPQSPVAIIGDAHVFLVELQVDENDITKIRLGQEVLITMDSYKGKLFNGVVSKIGSVMSETSRSFTVEARFENRPSVLFPNLTVEANIVIRTKKKALIIPRNYLVADKYVLLKNNKRKEIVCGLKDYQAVEIISGLKPGDVILKPME